MHCKKNLSILLFAILFLTPIHCLARAYSNQAVNFTINLPESWIPVEFDSGEQDAMFVRHLSGGYDSSLMIKSQVIDSATPYTLDDLSDKQIKDIVDSTCNSVYNASKALIENKVIQVAGHKALFFVTQTAMDDTKVNTVWVLFILKDVIYTISISTNSSTYHEVLPDLQQMLKTFQQYELPSEIV